MVDIEVQLSDRLATEIDRLVERGEFLNREQAMEELLSMGVSAYESPAGTDDEPEETLFTQAVEDQQDPAMRDRDEPGF